MSTRLPEANRDPHGRAAMSVPEKAAHTAEGLHRLHQTEARSMTAGETWGTEEIPQVSIHRHRMRKTLRRKDEKMLKGKWFGIMRNPW